MLAIPRPYNNSSRIDKVMQWASGGRSRPNITRSLVQKTQCTINYKQQCQITITCLASDGNISIYFHFKEFKHHTVSFMWCSCGKQNKKGMFYTKSIFKIHILIRIHFKYLYWYVFTNLSILLTWILEKNVIKTRNNLSENLQGNNKYYKGYSTLDIYFKWGNIKVQFWCKNLFRRLGLKSNITTVHKDTVCKTESGMNCQKIMSNCELWYWQCWKFGLHHHSY
jgi:hypothetical protein